jgi:hypothetical protein
VILMNNQHKNLNKKLKRTKNNKNFHFKLFF